MIIAELCQNHNGDLGVLRKLVREAASCGVDFVKIQSFFADDLNPEFCPDNYTDEYERLKKLELSWNEHKLFTKWCFESGVTPMTSVYSSRYIGQLKDAGFEFIKIGSAQTSDLDLITPYRDTGFEVLASSGGRELLEMNYIKGVSYLHCVSKYPHKAIESDLQRMLKISNHQDSRLKFGFSDHSDPTDRERWAWASKFAILLGASYIERHFTILGADETKDGPVSILPWQLKDLCDFEKLDYEEQIKQVPSWFGVFLSPKTQSEKDLIKRYANRWK